MEATPFMRAHHLLLEKKIWKEKNKNPVMKKRHDKRKEEQTVNKKIL